MAQRTVADFITPKQQHRLDAIFRETLLATACDRHGPQRIVEHEDWLKTILECAFEGFVEPYLEFVSPDVEVLTDYSAALMLREDAYNPRSPQKKLPGCKQAKIPRRLRLVLQTDNCPSDQAFVMVLRKEGYEFADPWDLAAFIGRNPEVPNSSIGKVVYAPIPPSVDSTELVLAHFRLAKEEWVLGLEAPLGGHNKLVRRIEK